MVFKLNLRHTPGGVFSALFYGLRYAAVFSSFKNLAREYAAASLFLARLKSAALPVLFFVFSPVLNAADLGVAVSDLRITQGADGGYHLYIRKKPDVQSVMLCETTRDPAMRADTYAYRAREPNLINGDEKRVLDGRFIAPDRKNVYLMDSTAEYIPHLRAEVFHIYIPYIVLYGYPEQRHGEVYVGDGTFLNIRAFAMPYGDYSGAYQDNPFELQVVQKPLEGPAELNYMKETEEAAKNMAAETGGEIFYSRGPEDVVQKISGMIKVEADKSPLVDFVIVLDTTASMKNDIDQIKKDLLKDLQKILEEQKNVRLGFVLFRDYREQYLTRLTPFSSDAKKIQQTLNSIRTGGGKDIPEAIHEALYEGAVKMDWRAGSRIMLLITDAPPHLRPRGKISEADAVKAAKDRSLKISAVILPQ
ncbi:MAG: VWA domain-containing protein [Spirochaetaceae bacterium]|jgi:Mg-chelatase subunit ChlD/putative component of toxin-antitoxin plasmid stabilization module|nr:VWA domain-containing protein [Spirochaetaceae bacterium]